MTRTLICAILALIGLVVVGTRYSNSQSSGTVPAAGWSLPSPTSTANDSMLMHNGFSSSGNQQVILVDTAKRVMAVYFIAPDTGGIQLKSVRSIAADLQLEEFNGADPSPSKVRSILNQP
jgi:hypothetical protein